MSVTGPQAVGRYRLVRPLGEDAFGTTHLADDTQSRVRVVVRLLPARANDTTQQRQQFFGIVQRLTRLRHPHLATVLDAGNVQDGYYVATEAIDGVPLEGRLIPDHPWPLKAALALIRHLASALHRLHQHGIVHQDVHPAGILLRANGEPVLVDVGLAAWLPAGRGTSLYRAPEQVKGGAVPVGPAADVWALGVLLYQMLTGRHPFAAPIEAEIRMRVQHLKVDPPTTLRPKLPARVDAILGRLLAKNPKQRPSSMTELSELLGELDELPSLVPVADVPATPAMHAPKSGNEAIAAAPNQAPGSPELMEVPLEVPDDPPSLLDVPASPRRRFRLALGVSTAALLCAVLAGLTSTWWLPGGPTQPSTRGEPPALKCRPIEEVTLTAGESRRRTLRVERTNCDGELTLEQDGQIDGLIVFLPPIAAGEDRVDITIATATTIRPGTHAVTLSVSGPGGVRAQTEVSLLVKPEVRLTRRLTNSIGMELALIPAGRYRRGSPDTEAMRNPHEGPHHEVEITQAFYMGVYEVTQGDYEKMMKANPSAFRRGGEFEDRIKGVDAARLPVENVTWEKAVAFCQRLNEIGAEKAAGRSYRLPTEAEWEYACRAGSGNYQPFHHGDRLSSKEANFEGNYPYGGAPRGPFLARPVPVNDPKYSPNAFGLHHMHGNVWEWCSDWYGEKEYQSCSDRGVVQDPRGPEQGHTHVLRGGSWFYGSEYCRSATRFWLNPGDRLDDIGFRVVCVVNLR